MSFKSYAAIIIGLTLLGFSIGLVLGVYLHIHTGTHLWVYIAVPAMGTGSAMAAYGTLRASKANEELEILDG